MRDDDHLAPAESSAVASIVGAIYMVLGALLLWWIMAPYQTLATVFEDTPNRVVQTARFFASATQRHGVHPNSWRTRPYPLIHHGVIQAEPAMLGLDKLREISLRFQTGGDHRFVDETTSSARPAGAAFTYVIDPAAATPWEPPLLEIDHAQSADLEPALLDGFSRPDRHLVVVTTATASMLSSGPLRDWLGRHGVDTAVFEGPSRPALVILPPASAIPRVPYVIAPPRGFYFRF